MRLSFFTELKVRAIFNVPERHAFCIFLSTPLALLATSFCRMTSNFLDHPKSTSKMILHWLLSYRGCLCFNSHLSGAFFMVLSEVFLTRLLTHGQLISKAITCFSLLVTILASTLFALFHIPEHPNTLVPLLFQRLTVA